MGHKVCRFGDCVVDRARNSVSSSAGSQQLPGRVMDVLMYLIEHQDRVVSTEELLSTFWDGRIVEESTIHRTISRIRGALGDSARNPRYILTVSKRGYQAIADVDYLKTPTIAETATAEVAGSAADNGQTARLWRRIPFWLVAGALIFTIAVLIVQWMPTDEAARYGGAETATNHGNIAELTSVAVLPLLGLSQDTNLGFFADGLADAILDELVKLNLKVAARTSTFAVARETADLAAIASKLGVAYLIEGSIQQDNEAIRVTTQLIRADDGYHVWSKTYDESEAYSFDTQSLIATNVARIVGAMIDIDIMRRRPEQFDIFEGISPKAVQYFIDGQYQYSLYALGEDGSWDYSVQLLRNAVAADPGFAAAHQQMAWAYMQRMGGQLAIGEASQAAHAAMEKALAIEPESNDSLLQLAQIQLTLDLDYAAAEKTIARGLELDPHGRWWYPLLADIAFREGRTADAARYLNSAAVIDFAEEQVSYLNLLAFYQIANYNYDAALQTTESARDIAAGGAQRAEVLRLQALAQVYSGRPDQAIEPLADALRIEGSKNLESYAALFASTGEAARARQILSNVKTVPGKAFYTALGYAHLGEIDRALEWLERGIEERESPIVSSLRSGSFWDSLRDDPQFAGLLRMLDAQEIHTQRYLRSIEYRDSRVSPARL